MDVYAALEYILEAHLAGWPDWHPGAWSTACRREPSTRPRRAG